MRVSELFDIKYGINLELDGLERSDADDAVNFVARTSENNGVVARVKPIAGKEPQPAGILTCAGGGSVLSTFVQDKPFYSGRDLYLLIPKQEMTLEEKLFYCHAIKMNAYRYSYGRQANRTLKDINLPPLPDWIKNYKIDFSKIDTKVKPQKMLLDVSKWKTFKISDLFTWSKGRYLSAEHKEKNSGDIPCVNGGSLNNGILCYLNKEIETQGFKLQKTPCLSVSRVGNSGLTFVQTKDFYIADNAYSLSLKNKNASKYVYLFISTILNCETFKYSYGRIINSNYFETAIKLPADKDGNPDWAYMENYIKSLPFSDLI